MQKNKKWKKKNENRPAGLPVWSHTGGKQPSSALHRTLLLLKLSPELAVQYSFFLGNLELNFDQIVTSSKYLGSSSRPPPSDNLTTNTWLAFNHCIFFSNQPQDDDAQDDDAGKKILNTFVLCVHN